MQQHTLKPTQKRKISKRLGRGNGSGRGTFCGRGCKGQGQRKSPNVPAWFEGGQTPLHRRLPKLNGFKSFGRVDYQVVNLSDLEQLKEVSIDKALLAERGLIRKAELPVKLLGNGKLSKKLTINVDKASQSALKAVAEQGGQVILPAPLAPKAEPQAEVKTTEKKASSKKSKKK